MQDIEPVGLIYPLDVHQPTTNFNFSQMNMKTHNNNNKMNRTKSKNSLILLPANASLNENPIWNKDFTKQPFLSVNNPKHKPTPPIMHQNMLDNLKTQSNPSPNSNRAQLQAKIIPLFKQDSNGATEAPLVFTVKPDLPAKPIAHIERKKNNYFSNEKSKQIITGQDKSVDESEQVFVSIALNITIFDLDQFIKPWFESDFERFIYDYPLNIQKVRVQISQTNFKKSLQ